jgi:hypothetical protein
MGFEAFSEPFICSSGTVAFSATEKLEPFFHYTSHHSQFFFSTYK